jgi:hypothetical protein
MDVRNKRAEGELCWEGWRRVGGGGRCGEGYAGVWEACGDEMVGLASKHPQNGSTRLLSAALIGCGSSDLRSYLHRVSDHEHQCRSLIYLKSPSMHLCCRVLYEAQLRSSSFSQAHPSVLTYAAAGRMRGCREHVKLDLPRTAFTRAPANHSPPPLSCHTRRRPLARSIRTRTSRLHVVQQSVSGDDSLMKFTSGTRYV